MSSNEIVRPDIIEVSSKCTIFRRHLQFPMLGSTQMPNCQIACVTCFFSSADNPSKYACRGICALHISRMFPDTFQLLQYQKECIFAHTSAHIFLGPRSAGWLQLHQGSDCPPSGGWYSLMIRLRQTMHLAQNRQNSGSFPLNFPSLLRQKAFTDRDVELS